jgi:hypothetical protein
MDQNERGAIKDIVKVIYHSRGDWRTPGGIARDLQISSETVTQIVKSHPEFFILAGDERAKFALRPGGLDAVSLTDSARNLYLQELTLSA